MKCEEGRDGGRTGEEGEDEEPCEDGTEGKAESEVGGKLGKGGRWRRKQGRRGQVMG